MSAPHRVEEFDLLAYADGFLNEDPARKAAVEARLARDPDAAARVAAYRAQTAALHAAYGPRIDDPVPDRLSAILDRPRPRRRGAQAAALAFLTFAAATGGWIAGRIGQDTTGWPAAAFLEQVQQRHAAAEPTLAIGADLMQAGGGDPLPRGAARTAFALPAPNLSALGFALADAQPAADGGRAAQLSYAAPDGRSFALFLQPQDSGRKEAIAVTTAGDLTIAYWRDGLLMSAVAARLPAAETRQLAETVRAAMHGPVPPADAGTETLEAAGLTLEARPAIGVSRDPAARSPSAAD